MKSFFSGSDAMGFVEDRPAVWDENDGVKALCFTRLLRNQQMAEVYWVKSSAHYGEPPNCGLPALDRVHCPLILPCSKSDAYSRRTAAITTSDPTPAGR